MKFVLISGLGFVLVTALSLLAVAWIADKESEPYPPLPHKPRCDCMRCGREMVKRYVKKYEDTAKREARAKKG